MVSQTNKYVRVGIFRFSLVIMAIVVLLSWINKIKLPDILLRAGISFGGMFLLLMGMWRLFEKTAPPSPEKKSPEGSSKRGSLVDFSVGDDQPPVSQTTASVFPGQVDENLSNGIPDDKQQAEIVRRMGWG